MTFFVGLSVSLVSPILPAIRDEFGLSYSMISFVVALFGLARLVTSLPAGHLYHKLNAKILVSSGIFLVFAGSLMAFLSKTFIEFLASQIITGVGFSFCVTTIMIYLSFASTKENRGKILGFNTMARSSSSIAAPVIAGIIPSVFLWRHVFFFYFIFALLMLFVSWFFVRHIKVEHKTLSFKAHANYNRYALASLLGTGFLASFSTAGFRATIIPLFAGDVMKLDIAAIGLVMGVSAVMHFITAPLAASLSDRYGRKKFLLLGLSAQLTGLLYFLFARNIFDLLVSSALLGIGTMIFILPPAIIGDISPHSKMSRNQSLLRFMIDLGFFAGPLILGIALDVYGFAFTAVTTMAVTAANLLAVYCFVKEPARTGKIIVEDGSI